MVGSGILGRGPRDRLIGTQVMVTKGPSKGIAGVVKDTNGNLARVELLTGNKVISIDKSKLRWRKYVTRPCYHFEIHCVITRADGTLEELDRRSMGGDMRPPSVNPNVGPRTPAWKTPAWQGGTTPNVQNPKTPAWQASSRTPNPYLDGGGKTPAWNVSSRTPNPYADGGKTPAWNVTPRTPNPYAGGGGSGSGWSGGGSGGGWGSNNWGGQSPGRTDENSNDWQADTWVSCYSISPRFIFALTPTLGCPNSKGSAHAIRCRSHSRVLRADTWIWAWPTNDGTCWCN